MVKFNHIAGQNLNQENIYIVELLNARIGNYYNLSFVWLRIQTITLMEYSIFWFRRDLRLEDNVGLFHALTSGKPVIPIFIFDITILEKLENIHDKRVSFIYKALKQLQVKLLSLGSTLIVKHGNPTDVLHDLILKYPTKTVYINHDYEPSAVLRDEGVLTLLHRCNVEFKTYKDQTIFEKRELLTKEGKPYTVFTPYSKKWKQQLSENPIVHFNSEFHLCNFWKNPPLQFPAITEFGFQLSGIPFVLPNVNESIIRSYQLTRNFPCIEGTTKLSVHLRFGTISIRSLVILALQLNEQFLNELIWREFYMMILWNFPYVVNRSFKIDYESIPWQNDEEQYSAWCQGKTGYPIVDAGMRELVATGFMHNRVRMIAASFLTKHLLIDWRWGEAFFAMHLLDYELASNNGGWQWAASSGCDAVPYFRIFNPHLQTEQFDSEFQYIKTWVPEFQTEEYVSEIVSHEFARNRCLQVYKHALTK